MKLLNLKLNNFQGLKEFEYQFDGENTAIYGRNASGKTTLFNSLTWLLFGTPSTAAKNFSPKTIGPDGEEHNLDHSVEAYFLTKDGEVIGLKRTFKEIWRTSKGSIEKTFSGHTTEYAFNGVPVTEKEYLERLPDQNTMKLLTMPFYFAEHMTWQERRNILLSLIPDLSEEELLNLPENKALSDLIKSWAFTSSVVTVDEYKKAMTTQRAALNKTLQAIPARIDEVKKAIPAEVKTILESSVKILTEEKEKLLRKKLELVVPGATYYKQKRELEAELDKIRTEATKSFEKSMDDWLKETNAETQLAGNLRNRKLELESEIAILAKTVEELTKMREELILEFYRVQELTWSEDLEICPCCNRKLDPEDVHEHIEKFNLDKAAKLKKIQEDGKNNCSIDTIKEYEDRLAGAKLLLEDVALKLENARNDVSGKSESAPVKPIFEELPAYKAVQAQIDGLTNEIDQEAVAKNDKEVEAITLRLEEMQKQVAAGEQAEALKKRLKELEQEQKDTAKSFEAAEYSVHLCEIFTRNRMKSLSEAINSKFNSVSFRLFVEQINGGIKEDCEVLIPGDNGQLVPFTFANNGARTNAALEIVEVLNQHFDLTMPVFVDNAESINELRPTSSQVIALYVSEDENLRPERI